MHYFLKTTKALRLLKISKKTNNLEIIDNLKAQRLTNFKNFSEDTIQILDRLILTLESNLPIKEDKVINNLTVDNKDFEVVFNSLSWNGEKRLV